MQKKESSLIKMAKVIVITSSVIGIGTVWGIAYYMVAVVPQEEAQVVNSRVVLTQSACAKAAGNKISQGDCYMKVARARRDETICAKVDIAEMKALCYVELAELKQDAALCEKSEVTPSLLVECRSFFAKAATSAAGATQADQ